MKKYDELKWFLIRKFIEILLVVGVAEYFITFAINSYVMPLVFEYFFPDYDNIRMAGSEAVAFFVVMMVLLCLGAIGSVFPFPINGIIHGGIEEIQSGLSQIMYSMDETTSVYTLDRYNAILLFLTGFALIAIVAAPYILGALCFAKITIKEFRAIQEEREQQQRDFDKKRNLMLSDIAHDLRTPMTTVNGYAKALADGMVTDETKKQEYLNAIQNKSVRMNELINLLFEYAKLDSEGFRLDKTKLDLCELLRENAALAYSDIEEAGMDFEVRIPEEPYYINVDSIQLSRVVTNLLNNAIRHNPKGTTITLSMKEEAAGVMVVVADDGNTIPDDISGHIFEPFAKGDSSRRSGGSGLGLSIAKKVINMHGWDLKFVSKPDDRNTKAFVIWIKKDKQDYIYG